MGTIANAKVTHYYNCYNGDFIGCLLKDNLRQLSNGKISMIDFAVCFTHNVKVQVMRQILLFITMFLSLVTISFAQSDYYIKKAQSYQREAEYYPKEG